MARKCCPKVKENLKFTHLGVKEGLQAFGKLHPASIGTDLVDGSYNQVSLSLRVLLSHYRRCTSPEVWATAKRTYKGSMSLTPVEDIIKKLVDSDDFEYALVPSTTSGDTQWVTLQSSAPRHALWEVCMGNLCRYRSDVLLLACLNLSGFRVKLYVLV